MVSNYFKTALRYLWSHKAFSAINLAGLAAALCVCFFALVYINFERSYDTYHVNADRIYRLVTDEITAGGTLYESTSAPMGPAIKSASPQVKAAARIFLDNLVIQKDDYNFNDENIAYADSSLFTVFTLPLISGDPSRALNDPYSIVLSESAAQKYFGSYYPIGQTLIIDGKYPAKVTGLMKDMPANSHFRVNILVSLSTLIKEWNPRMATNWKRFGFYTYLLLSKENDPVHLNSTLKDMVQQHLSDYSARYSLSLEPLKKVYLHGKPRGSRTGAAMVGDIGKLIIFSLVAAFVLFIACVNFINLTTALSLYRAREIGVRKVLGASRPQLMIQFLLDAVLLSLAAFVCAVVLCLLLMPFFNQLAGKVVAQGVRASSEHIWWLLLTSIALGLVSGIYPAFFLSGFRAISTLKGRFISGSQGLLLRKALVVTQFSLSIGLIICTIIVYAQLDFMKNHDLGFKKDHNLVIDFHFDERIGNSEASVKQELKSIPGVTLASISSCVPGKANRMIDTKIGNSKSGMQDFRLESYFIDYDFFKQYQIALVAGRPFSQQFSTDSGKAMLINETTAKALGYNDPKNALGRKFVQAGREGLIIGVVKDVHFHSFREPVQPLTFQVGAFSTFITLTISSENQQGTIDRLVRKWKDIAPGLPMVYFFQDDVYNSQYEAEERFGKLFVCLAALAILISGIGLLGLSAFNAIQRTKEIGIRKVLGASVGSIVGILSIDFLRLIGIAFLVSCPISYLAISWWLQEFAYRVNISWWVFALTGAGALLLGFFTIGIQTVRAALVNPVRSLKFE